MHYSQKNWWVTVGALLQVWGWSADGPAASNEGKDWDEHERVHVGFIVGFEFGGRAKRSEEDRKLLRKTVSSPRGQIWDGTDVALVKSPGTHRAS